MADRNGGSSFAIGLLVFMLEIWMIVESVIVLKEA